MATRAWPWSLLLVSLLWSGLVFADTRKCYNPDSSQAVDDVPCTSDDTTWCCNKVDVCMSNGLCFLQQSSGFALSRPSCTDLSWEACGEWKYCFNYNPSSGFPIVSGSYNGNNTVHCCGQATYANGTVTCPLQEVSVPYGTAMPGVAGLAVSSTNPSNTSCAATNVPKFTSTSSSRDAAIGVGVGVPLGVIAISALLWAFWERRSRMNAISQFSQASVNQGMLQPTQQMAYGRPPVELQAPIPSAELGGSYAATELGSEGSHKNHP